MTLIALWLASNALLFAWLAFGRFNIARCGYQPKPGNPPKLPTIGSGVRRSSDDRRAP